MSRPVTRDHDSLLMKRIPRRVRRSSVHRRSAVETRTVSRKGTVSLSLSLSRGSSPEARKSCSPIAKRSSEIPILRRRPENLILGHETTWEAEYIILTHLVRPPECRPLSPPESSPPCFLSRVLPSRSTIVVRERSENPPLVHHRREICPNARSPLPQLAPVAIIIKKSQSYIQKTLSTKILI